MAVALLTCLPEIRAKVSEVAMKSTARTVVAVARNGAAPLPPKKDSPPPKAEPRPPLPDCIRTTAISVRQAMICEIISKVNKPQHLHNNIFILYQK